MRQRSIFSNFSRFSGSSPGIVTYKEPICRLPSAKKSVTPLTTNDTSPVVSDNKETFEKEFVTILDRIITGSSEDTDVQRLFTRVKEILTRTPIKKPSIPYFYHPKYRVEGNTYQVQDTKEVIIVASLAALVPEVILYPFGEDVLSPLPEATSFEMTINDSEGKTGVAEAQLELNQNDIAYVTFDAFYEVPEEASLRRKCRLSDFVLPATFSGRFSLI